MAQYISKRIWVNTAEKRIDSNLMLVVVFEFDMFRCCNAGAQNPSESFGNNLQKLPNAHGRKSGISNLRGGGGEPY